ncbi:MAG: hypothetical protein R3F31_19115 [Verrucomicrobiales bacterium]
MFFPLLALQGSVIFECAPTAMIRMHGTQVQSEYNQSDELAGSLAASPRPLQRIMKIAEANGVFIHEEWRKRLLNAPEEIHEIISAIAIHHLDQEDRVKLG